MDNAENMLGTIIWFSQKCAMQTFILVTDMYIQKSLGKAVLSLWH